MSTPTPARPWLATALHQRAVVGGLLLVLGGVVFHRPDLVVLAAPLLLIAAWGRLARPRGQVAGRLSTGTRDVVEGQAVAVHVDVAGLEGADTLGIDPGPAPGLRAEPLGAVVPVTGPAVRATVSVEPSRWGPTSIGHGEVHARSAWGAYDAAWAPPAPLRLDAWPAHSPFDADAPVPSPSRLLGTHRGSRRGDGVEFDSIREFRPGDRPRHVHWPTSARTGRLHVRTTRAENDAEIVVVVDAFGDVPGRPEGSLTRSVHAAASVAGWCTRTGDRVGLRVLGAASSPVPSGTGRRQLVRILGTLARVVPASERNPDDVRLHLSLAPGSLVVVVSPLTERRLLAATAEPAARGFDVIVIDTAPDEVDADDAAEDLAWSILQLERDRTVAELRARGVAVVPWHGAGTLDRALAGLAARRTGVR